MKTSRISLPSLTARDLEALYISSMPLIKDLSFFEMRFTKLKKVWCTMQSKDIEELRERRPDVLTNKCDLRLHF